MGGELISLLCLLCLKEALRSTINSNKILNLNKFKGEYFVLYNDFWLYLFLMCWVCMLQCICYVWPIYYLQQWTKYISTFCKQIRWWSGGCPIASRNPKNYWRIFSFIKSCQCDNIHAWISLSGDLVFSHQHGIYGFKFPKGSLEISSRDLTSSSLLLIWRPDYQYIDALSLCIHMAQCLPSSQAFSQFIRPSSLLSYTSKLKAVCV